MGAGERGVATPRRWQSRAMKIEEYSGAIPSNAMAAWTTHSFEQAAGVTVLVSLGGAKAAASDSSTKGTVAGG
jgi:hypothetical protein